jgi:hypothetical protein
MGMNGSTRTTLATGGDVIYTDIADVVGGLRRHLAQLARQIDAKEVAELRLPRETSGGCTHQLLGRGAPQAVLARRFLGPEGVEHLVVEQ